ncbi:hypothetical protein MKW92_042229 [Papaver armeniacum]|nr:hypothetical protein MKW92_042229 [Papaver armeniacum]
MANNQGDGTTNEDYFEQILANPSFYVNQTSSETARLMAMQLSSSGGGGGGEGSSGHHLVSAENGVGFQELGFRLEQQQQQQGIKLPDETPLGLRLEQQMPTTSNGFDRFGHQTSSAGHHPHPHQHNNNEREPMHLTSLFPAFEHVQPHSVRPAASQPLHAHQTSTTGAAAPHPPAFRPRVRARRGQATDPHSIAERRERIAERMKALQELVPSFSKTDKATMLDEVVDYVKFLRLQVKVLSMSRLGGAGAVAQLVSDVPLPSVEGEDLDGTNQAREKWSSNETEEQVAKLMEKDVGTAMQFLQSKALCIMPISLAAAIYPIYQPDSPSTLVKPE